jgi:hypothetical protein
MLLNTEKKTIKRLKVVLAKKQKHQQRLRKCWRSIYENYKEYVNKLHDR